MEPCAEKDYEFVDKVKGGVIPSEYIPACDKGFRACLTKGRLIGFPIVGVRCTVNDGNWHPVDSSDIAFQLAAIGAFRQAYEKARPEILEPVMKVSVEGPVEFQGNILATINQRRGIIVSCYRRDQLLPRRCGGPARGDVRLLHGAAFVHAGQGRIHHGISQIQQSAGVDR